MLDDLIEELCEKVRKTIAERTRPLPLSDAIEVYKAVRDHLNDEVQLLGDDLDGDDS